jgi:hypothetical protein
VLRADYWWGNRYNLYELRGVEGGDRSFEAAADKAAIRFTAQVSSYVTVARFVGTQDTNPTYKWSICPDDGSGIPDTASAYGSASAAYDTADGEFWYGGAITCSTMLNAGQAYWLVIEQTGGGYDTDHKLLGGFPYLQYYPNDRIDDLDDESDQNTDTSLTYKFWDNDGAAWFQRDLTPLFWIQYANGAYQGIPYACLNQVSGATESDVTRYGTLTHRAIYGTSYKVAQLFVPDSTMHVNKLKVTCRENATPAPGPLYCRIVRVSDSQVIVDAITVSAAGAGNIATVVCLWGTPVISSDRERYW